MQANQLAHRGIETVEPTVTGQPITARVNCKTAMTAKMNAARRE